MRIYVDGKWQDRPDSALPEFFTCADCGLEASSFQEMGSGFVPLCEGCEYERVANGFAAQRFEEQSY